MLQYCVMLMCYLGTESWLCSLGTVGWLLMFSQLKRPMLIHDSLNTATRIYKSHFKDEEDALDLVQHVICVH